VPSLKFAERSTSRLPPGMFPACGSVGAPVCDCQATSFCRTTPSSPSGSPLRIASLPVSAARVGSAPSLADSA
jgi:hypothetical protein